MIQILLAGGGLTSLTAFKTAFEEEGARTTCLESGRKAMDAVSEKTFDLLIADETLEDMTGLKLIETLITSQPMLNCAVVSSLSAADYHEASEGLGILMQLPVAPGRKEAGVLMNHLKKIQSFKVGS